MDELVKTLSEKQHTISANRTDKSIESFQKRIDSKYIHILFEETGTEIGMKLDPKNCHFDKANYVKKTGKVHLEGALTLNYDRVKCITDISIRTMKGKGSLQIIEDESEYSRIIKE